MPPIADWQLVPIAEFADSSHDACVTLFGSLQDEEQDRRMKEKGYQVVSYHPAFEHRLLGMRLMHLDILILTDVAAELFKEDGDYLLGTGEQQPNVQNNLKSWRSVSAWLANQKVKFTSYVVSDKNQAVTFAATGSQLRLTGDLYWDAWRRNQKFDPEAASRIAFLEFKEEFERDRNRLSAPLFNAKYTESYQRDRQQELFDKHSAAAIIPMAEYSKGLSRKIQSVGGVNPAVYEAGRTTMRYSAFFRYVKKANPNAWANFVRSLGGVQVARVDTPNLYPGRVRTP